MSDLSSATPTPGPEISAEFKSRLQTLHCKATEMKQEVKTLRRQQIENMNSMKDTINTTFNQIKVCTFFPLSFHDKPALRVMSQWTHCSTSSQVQRQKDTKSQCEKGMCLFSSLPSARQVLLQHTPRTNDLPLRFQRSRVDNEKQMYAENSRRVDLDLR